MHIVHAVSYDLADLLQALEGPHRRYCVSLHHHIALCQQLYRLQRGSIGANKALTALDEALLRRNEAIDFDDVASHVVLQNLQRVL